MTSSDTGQITQGVAGVAEANVNEVVKAAVGEVAAGGLGLGGQDLRSDQRPTVAEVADGAREVDRRNAGRGAELDDPARAAHGRQQVVELANLGRDRERRVAVKLVALQGRSAHAEFGLAFLDALLGQRVL